ncbi:MAG: hypothetical protein IT245_02600 [Bacteroidia bacterium]|nr:hypothetical protein [Bacteroidia bacterium]
MDSHFKLIYIFTLLIAFSSCAVEIEEPIPNISSGKSVLNSSITEVNTLRSDFLNWDSIEFHFSHFENITYFSNCNPVFMSNAAIPDTLILRFTQLPYNNINQYYVGAPSSEARINKFPGRKINSNGNGQITYTKIEGDSVEIGIDLLQNTFYRLPDNSNLKATIKGRFKMPKFK